MGYFCDLHRLDEEYPGEVDLATAILRRAISELWWYRWITTPIMWLDGEREDDDGRAWVEMMCEWRSLLEKWIPHVPRDERSALIREIYEKANPLHIAYLSNGGTWSHFYAFLGQIAYYIARMIPEDPGAELHDTTFYGFKTQDGVISIVVPRETLVVLIRAFPVIFPYGFSVFRQLAKTSQMLRISEAQFQYIIHVR